MRIAAILVIKLKYYLKFFNLYKFIITDGIGIE
jgi:hypothetical protein